MPTQKDALKDHLSRYRQIKISVIGRKSGRTISNPVWFVLDDEKLFLDGGRYAIALRIRVGVCRCIERWGGETVCEWYWCVWNEPNNTWITGGLLTFEHYRRIYEEVAQAVIKWLGPYLGGRRPLIGGPAIEGFTPGWWDWAWRFVNEIDNALIGFLDWHRYAEWRNLGQQGAPLNEATYRSLMASQALDYQFRARAIGQQTSGREILNICGELN